MTHFFQGIRGRFIRWTALLTLSVSVIAAVLFYVVLRIIVRDIGSDFAVQHTLREKGRILAPVEREVALCEAMVKMPAILDWIQDEKNPALKAVGTGRIGGIFAMRFVTRAVF